jgi:hypothetical protein
MCAQRFDNKKDLGRHSLTHATRRVDAPQFVCREPACKKKNVNFLRKDKLDSHINSVHNGAGRETNVCNSCGAGFRSPHDLRRHEASRHNITAALFRCGMINCRSKNKIWKRKDNLKEHVRKQHGEERTDLIIEM